MSQRNDGGPAFPIPGEGSSHGKEPGMTLLHYFAAHAPAAPQIFIEHGQSHGFDLAQCHAEWAREYAYTLLDAMKRGTE